MYKNDFGVFLRVLKLVRNFSTDVMIKNGYIFQLSDSRSGIIELDMSQLFEPDDYKTSIVILNLPNKLDLLKLLYSRLQKDDDRIAISLTKDGKFIRFAVNEEFYEDFALISPQFLDDIIAVTPDFEQMIKNLSEENLIWEEKIPYNDFRMMKTAQDKTNGDGIGYYIYKNMGMKFIDNFQTGINIKLGNWEPKHLDFIRPDIMYEIKLLIDASLPDTENDIKIEMYKKPNLDVDSTHSIIVKATSNIENVDIKLYSVYTLREVSKSDDVILSKHFTID